MAGDRLFLVFALPHHPGIPIYLHRTAEISNGTRGTASVLKPVFDDDIERSQVWTSPEFAAQARDHWRSRGYSVVLRDREGNGPLFERESSQPVGPENRQQQYVRFTNGKVLLVTTAIRPDGKCWAVRAVDIPTFREDGKHTVLETIFGSTPEEAAQRAVDIHGQQILFADPEAASRAQQERERAAQQQQFIAGLRPGDRR